MTKYVLLVMTQGEGKKNILVVKKSKPPEQFGKLNFIGGKVDPGETFEQAVIRESIEESGLTPCNLELCGYIKGKEFKSIGEGQFAIAVYHGVSTVSDIKPAEGESDEPFWIDGEQLYDLPPQLKMGNINQILQEVALRMTSKDDGWEYPIAPFILLEGEEYI